MGSLLLPSAAKDIRMPLMMYAAIFLTFVGIAVALTAHARAPVSERYAIWDLVFIGGFGAAALGGTGLMVVAMIL